MLKRRRLTRRLFSRKRRRLNIPRLLQARGSRNEIKVVDQSIAQNYTTAGTLIFLNQIRIGSDFCQRVGRKIAMTGIKLNLTVQTVDAVIAATVRLRTMLVYDRQTNGAATSFQDICSGVTAASAVTNDVWDGINMNARERYLVLMDSKMSFPALPTAVGNTQASYSPSMREVHIVKHINLKNIQTIYAIDAASITEVTTGALYLVICGTNDNEYILNGAIRLRFKDS